MSIRIRTALGALALVAALVATAGVAQAAQAKPDFTIDHVSKNKKKGTAKIYIDVPGPGNLALEGTGRSKSDQERANSQGTAVLNLQPNKKGKKKLRKKGKVPFNAVITYTPDGGQPSTEAYTVNLILKKKG